MRCVAQLYSSHVPRLQPLESAPFRYETARLSYSVIYSIHASLPNNVSTEEEQTLHQRSSPR